MTGDHELLGIEPNADPDEVRAAYIVALKRLHPDASGNAKDAQKVSDLVSAYRRLRNSARRKDDPRAAGQILLRANRRHGMPAPRPSPPALLWGRFVALALLAGASVSAALVVYPDQAGRKGLAPVTSALPPEMPAEWAEPDEGTVRQAVGALQSFSSQDGALALEAHSRRCFAELEMTRDFRLLDYCLAFDIAAAQTDAISKSAPEGRAFFGPAEIRARHSGALRLLIGDLQTGRVRQSRIESQTVSALATAVSVNDLGRWPR